MSVVFSSSQMLPLADVVCKKLGATLSGSVVSTFNDGETRVALTEKSEKVFLFHSICPPSPNNSLIETAFMADAARRNGARNIVAIIPYLGYARQDHLSSNGEPLSGRIIADLLQDCGVSKLYTVELHSDKCVGFFKIPVFDLSPLKLIIKAFSYETDLCVVSPDAGGVKRANNVANALNASLAVVHKTRPKPGEASVVTIEGNVQGKNCLMVDDIIDTGGSLLNAAKVLKEKGALTVKAFCTHAVLSKDAIEKVENSKDLQELVVTDTIPLKKQSQKIRVQSVAEILAEALAEETAI